MNAGGETGDYDAPRGFVKDFIEGRDDGTSLDPVRPSRSTLVESASSARTPSPAVSRNLSQVNRPADHQVVSWILKSPVCTMTPTGVRIASATHSISECET